MNLKPLVPTATANIKCSPTPNQMHINLTLKAILPQFLLPNTSHVAFNKRLYDMLRGKKKTV